MEHRTVKRNAICRICDKTLIRDIDKAITFSFCSGKHIDVFICESCIEKCYNLIKGCE